MDDQTKNKISLAKTVLLQTKLNGEDYYKDSIDEKHAIRAMLEFVEVYNKQNMQIVLPEIYVAIDKIRNKIEDEQFIRNLTYTNDYNFVIIKAAEECAELNKILLQSLTKPDQTTRIDIIKEIADVEIQFYALKELLLCDEEVKSQIPIKIDKLKEYKEIIPNFGKLK